MSRLRVGVWGLGRHAVDKIVPAVSQSAGLALHGVCGRRADRVSAVASAAGCVGWTDPGAMLADPDVDVVYVATPTGLHAEHGTAVLDAGKHLWCEKPLTCTPSTTQALLERSRAARLTVSEGFMHLYHPQFAQLSGYVRSGRLGRVRSIACRFGIPSLDFSSFRSDPALGGSALLDVGCYTIAAVHALFPDARPRVAYASVTTQAGSVVDTDGQAVLSMGSEAVAQLEWKTNCAYINDLAIWGDAGSLFTDKIFSKPPAYVPEFRLRDVNGVEVVELGVSGNHFVSMFNAFTAMTARPEDAEAERQRIAWRAGMLDRIRSTAQQQGAL